MRASLQAVSPPSTPVALQNIRVNKSTHNDLQRKLAQSGLDVTCIHWQNFIIAKHVGDILRIGSQHIIIERSGSQAELRCLGGECSYDLGMAVALVYSTVCTEEVKVPVAPHIPHIDAWEEGEKTDGHVRVKWFGDRVRQARLIWFGHV